jgi:hypothetical protein
MGCWWWIPRNRGREEKERGKRKEERGERREEQLKQKT